MYRQEEALLREKDDFKYSKKRFTGLPDKILENWPMLHMHGWLHVLRGHPRESNSMAHPVTSCFCFTSRHLSPTLDHEIWFSYNYLIVI